MSKSSISQRDGFVYFSNRASRQFAGALEGLGGRAWQDQESPAVIDLLYFDSYGGKLAPAVRDDCFRLISRQRTAALDNKAEMARVLLAAGLDEPSVYFSARAVPAESDSLWYVKLPYASGGRGIRILNSRELLNSEIEGVVIQEAVQDLMLVEQRKFTLRLYVLVLRGELYLYEEGFIVIHAATYNPQSRDPAVQFAHEGYMNSDSGLRLSPASALQGWQVILNSAARKLEQVFAVFRDRLRHERASHYCLFGVDMLVRQDQSCVLVEINDRPNLVHTGDINQKVNIPMLRAMATVLNPVWQERIGSDTSVDRFRRLAGL